MPTLKTTYRKKPTLAPARFCKVCGTKLEGRRDKKYCNQECKNQYHISMRTLHKTDLETDLKILFRNRTILHEILDQEGIPKKKVSLDSLILLGFHTDYCTGIYRNKQNKEYRYVFDYAWMTFSDREVLILKKDAALKK